MSFLMDLGFGGTSGASTLPVQVGVPTSGSVSETKFRTRQVIDHAFRRVKIPAQMITSEMIDIAKDSLYLLMSSLANEGAPLWCIDKQILPLYYGVYSVPCPLGTVDVLNANLRDLSRLTGTYTASEGVAANAFDSNLLTQCEQFTNGGYIQIQLASPTQITTIGMMPAANGTWNFNYLVSSDGITYQTVGSFASQVVQNGQWLWVDIEGIPNASYCKIQAVGDTTLDVIEFFVANTPSEITLARINKDDYTSLPNKTALSRPTEYWFDRQRIIPIMTLWPAPDTATQFRQLVIWRHRHIMDVGTMYQIIDVPQRWYDPIIWALAERLGDEIPDVKPEVMPRVSAMKQASYIMAWGEERDASPLQIMPNLSMYSGRGS